MRAMVLAAGVGSRLRPLTDATPKALIEVGGLTMLERAVRALKAAGADRVVVNVHHHAEQVARFVASRDLGLPIDLSREDGLLLDTGGGIKKAEPLLRNSEPFVVHNVDVATTVDLRALVRAHVERGALATLAVRDRPGKRRLLFDRDGRLRGREGEGTRPEGGVALAFDGIHVLSPGIFDRITETGVFSIASVYLRLAAAGGDIRAFRTDGTLWTEIGTPERLAEARALLEANRKPC